MIYLIFVKIFMKKLFYWRPKFDIIYSYEKIQAFEEMQNEKIYQYAHCIDGAVQFFSLYFTGWKYESSVIQTNIPVKKWCRYPLSSGYLTHP